MTDIVLLWKCLAVMFWVILNLGTITNLDNRPATETMVKMYIDCMSIHTYGFTYALRNLLIIKLYIHTYVIIQRSQSIHSRDFIVLEFMVIYIYVVKLCT